MTLKGETMIHHNLKECCNVQLYGVSGISFARRHAEGTPIPIIILFSLPECPGCHTSPRCVGSGGYQLPVCLHMYEHRSDHLRMHVL